MSKRTTYLLLGVFVLLLVLLSWSGTAWATTFSTPVDADYGHIANSAYLSAADFPRGAPVAVLAGSESYPEQLAATVLAKVSGGPLLLTSSTTLSTSVRTELGRLEVTKVYIIGLSATIVSAVKSALPGLAADKVVVLTGSDAYQTAALVAGEVKGVTGKTPARVFIVPGDVWGSASAAAAVAAANGWPIVLTPQSGPFPAASAQAISGLGVKTGIRVDTNVNPEVSGFSIEKTIMGITSTADDPGARYTECLDLAKYALEQGWASCAHVALGEEQGGSVAYSQDFPDNVLLASHIARQGGAYLLARSTGLHAEVAAFLRQHGRDIDSVAFMRPDYDQVQSGAWSFETIRQVKSLNSPRVTGLSSTSGALEGGGTLKVTGTGFSGATTVRVGKTDLPAANWQVNSDTSITIKAMPAAAQQGAVEVLVSNYWYVNPSNVKDVYLYVSDPANEPTGMKVVKEAIKYLGVPYVWAGASPSGGFDCSGLTMYVYNKFATQTGVTLPHKSTYQANYGTPVGKDELFPGDLVFFGSPIGHVGIYVGNGLMINSPRSGDLVCVEDAFRTNYTSARRLISPYTRIEQNDPLSRLAYTGDWNLKAGSASASGGSYGYADSAGSSVTVTFDGTYLQWMAKKSTAYGLARVTLDGRDAGTVDLYSLPTLYKQKVWDTGMLPAGRHTVTITWTGISTGGGTNIGVDAFDIIGTFVKAQPPGVPVRYQDTDRAVVYTGLWENSAAGTASGGCFRYIGAAGSVSITFEGTAASWVGTKGPGYGIARVRVDGVDKGTVDLYGSTTTHGQTLWSVTGLDAGHHTITVEWTGQKNTAASGSNISVDAFDVLGTPVVPAGLIRYEQTGPLLTWDGKWYRFNSATASAGSYERANGGSSATVHFNGTYLSWVATAGTTLSKAQVSLDGGPAQTVDLARSVVAYQQGVWATGMLSQGPHTVKISWAGDAAEKFISVDAFDVIGTVTDGTVAPPTITGLDPTSGPATGGTTVAITGTGFKDVSAVTFDGQNATQFTVASSTRIAATSPAHAAGKADVRVVGAAGTSANTAADDFTYVAVVTTVRYEQGDGHIGYAGKWSDYAKPGLASGDSYGRSNTAGASATIYFEGTRLDWIAMKGTTTGIAEVYVDGTWKARVNLAATTPDYQVNAFSTGTLAAGVHKVEIVRSPACPVGKHLTLDAVEIWGKISDPPQRYEQTDARIAKVGNWSDFVKPGLAFGDSYGRANSTGASATVAFRGPRLDLYAMKGTTTGIVDIYVDGTRAATVDLRASSPSYKVAIFTTGTLFDGPHTVKIAANEYSPAGKFITLDAVDVWGTIEAAP